jgi:hypothetical protein
VRIFRFIIAFGAILHLGGGHWGILQGIAWAKMLVEYSQADGIGEGIAKTFDGEHPCAMCKVISKGRESEKREPLAPLRADAFALKNLLPMEEICVERNDYLLPCVELVWFDRGLRMQWKGSPDAPPPRATVF